jgi:hypothetical protein
VEDAVSYDIADTERRVLEALAMDDAEAVAGLGKFLDRLDVSPPVASPRGAALWYANRGLWVLPLQPGLKTPYRGTQGVLDASCDPRRVGEMFAERPDSNVGIATGHLVDVIDIDGPVGMKSYADHLLEDDPEHLAEGYGRWADPDNPVLGTVSTPRPGGKHLYVAAREGRGNRAEMLPGIDTRGLGGYVVAPPSWTEVGRYEWVVPLDLG